MLRQERLDELLGPVERTRHGYSPVRAAADEIVAEVGREEAERLAERLMADGRPQVRMLSALLFGEAAAQSERSLQQLREVVSQDPDWRVQEMLAQAFERVCAARGYERCLALIESWLGDPAPNVRRAASEGPRIWTSRPYFKSHPEHAIRLLAALRADPSEYVRKSVGNALRDISRKHPALVRAELAPWDRADQATAQTYTLASKFIEEQ